MAAEDKTLVCRDCGAEFTFSVGEQEFYQQKGFQHAPSRCPECRARKRMRDQGDSLSGRPQYPVICSDCGRETTVPFEPHSDKPVYCQTCFARHRRR